MNRSELTVLIALGLLGAMLFGWILRWIWGSFAVARNSGIDTIETLTKRAETADEGRQEAIRELRDTERKLRNEMRAKTAELEAAMDGLRAARLETSEWKAYAEAQEARANANE